MDEDRLDRVLVKKYNIKSRERAKTLITMGFVTVKGEKVTRPDFKISDSDNICISKKDNPYVSRGGLKLEKALEDFNIEVKGKICMDVGASTGGFTDCLLEKGARKVYAVDVGYGQLDWKLRQDKRVVILERTNIRYLSPDLIQDPIDMVTIDVSFISLEKVLPKVKEIIKNRGIIVALIKPQFEAGRKRVEKGGVVKDVRVHREVIKKIKSCGKRLELAVEGLITSPLKGPAGNIEYFIFFRNL